LEKIQSDINEYVNSRNERLGIIRHQAWGETSYVNVEYVVKTSITEPDPEDKYLAGVGMISQYLGTERTQMEITSLNLPTKEWDEPFSGIGLTINEHHVYTSLPIPPQPWSSDVETVIKEFENNLQSNIFSDADNEKLRDAIARLRALQR
jgi:hypothetical protein